MSIRNVLMTMSVFLLVINADAQQKKVQTKQPLKATKPVSEKAIPKSDNGTIFFDKTSHSFSEINEILGKTHADFTFANIGKGDLKIVNISTGCGCTSAEWDQNRVYKQGEKDHLTIYFNPKGLQGKFNRTITVETDGDPRVTYLNIDGSISGPTSQLLTDYPHLLGDIRLSKNVISFPHAVYDKRDSTYLKIYNTTKSRIQIMGVKTPDYIKGKIQNFFIAPEEFAMINFVFSPDSCKVYGPVEDQITLVTNEKEMPVKTISFQANVEENFSNIPAEQRKLVPKIVFKEITKDFGEVYYGEVVEYNFDFVNKGKSDLIIRRAFGSCGCTVARAPKDPVKKGKSGTISVRFDSHNLFREQVKTVSVITNDPDHPVTKLTIKAKMIEPGVKK